jgi:hypothetical protein
MRYVFSAAGLTREVLAGMMHDHCLPSSAISTRKRTSEAWHCAQLWDAVLVDPVHHRVKVATTLMQIEVWQDERSTIYPGVSDEPGVGRAH